MPNRNRLAGLALLSVTACADQSTSPDTRRIALSAAKSPAVSDPTATWLIPLNDAGLSIRSDHSNGDGTNSVYANGVCGVSTTIFATTAQSTTPSGDATISFGGRGKCTRTITLVYPDGLSESVGSFNNLNTLESPTFAIPVGQTVKRRLVVNPAQINANASRCGTLYFGPRLRTGPSVGGDSLLVTRLTDSTWQIRSQTAPNDRAYCEANGDFYEMPLSFVIVANRRLP